MHPLAFKRLAAFGVDWLVFSFWAGLLAIIVSSIGIGWASRVGVLSTQGLSFAGATLPFALYFAALESGKGQASIGKSVMKLRVEGRAGERLGFGRALGRALLKFVPWELGHLQVNLVLHGVEGAGVWIPTGLCWVGVFWYASALALGGVPPYDRVVRARVVAAGSGERGSS